MGLVNINGAEEKKEEEKAEILNREWMKKKRSHPAPPQKHDDLGE